jgi:hypothetical protein
MSASTGAAVETEDDVTGQRYPGRSGAATPAASVESFPFDKAFELELKSVQARRLLMARERDGGAYFTEGYSARVGAALTRAPMETLPTQFNFARMPGASEDFLFADTYAPGEPITEADGLNLTGMCMSGGGIRSAAVNLGVTQALDSLSPSGRSDVIDSLDYLSTVSGGNYIGTSICAGMMQPQGATGALPAARYPHETKTDGAETPETRHLRDHSSYLMPNGFRDIVANLLIVARGLVANAVMFLAALLFLASCLLVLTPTTGYLARPLSLRLADGLLPEDVGWPLWAGGFVLSLVLATGILLLMLVWTALKRRMAYRMGLDERERINPFMVLLTGIVALIAFIEWQPAILSAMRATRETTAGATAPGWLTWLTSQLGQAGYVFGPAAAALFAFGSKLVSVVKAAAGDVSLLGRTRRILGMAALAVLGLSIPILLWVSLLNLVHAGICVPQPPREPCLFDAPGWFLSLGSWGGAPPVNPVLWLYLGGFIACFLITISFSPNANSLHQLYRDRLSRAFLMERGLLAGRNSDKPSPDGSAGTTSGKVSVEDNGERRVYPDDYTFSSLKPLMPNGEFAPSASWAPYLLVNSAINLQADYLGQRGRQADVFTFGPLASGSEATGYARTADLEDRHPQLTLASGLAISGAAASANMGGNTKKIITFSLAALNIRLGYWLPNPAKLDLFPAGGRKADGSPALPPWRRKESGWGLWYFGRELLSRIGQTSRRVHLTDGGHIENLGLYELTKRRCRVIIAVDAEADQGMVCPSLVKVQLMMRVDHGVRIELPWTEISAASRAADAKVGTANEDEIRRKAGPHVAVGRIIYRDKLLHTKPVDDVDANAGQALKNREQVHGVLIYIKSSMTGDENDGIRDYKRRHGDFPHETTLDQFFSEEQFEVYRGLGFHMAHGFVSGRDEAAFWTPDDNVKRAEFLQDVESALRSIAIPEANIKKIMERARTRADELDKACDPDLQSPDVAAPVAPLAPVAPAVAAPAPKPAKARTAARKKRGAG